MNFNKISLACLVLSGSALLAACGGDSTPLPPAAVASGNTAAVINPQTGAAVVSGVLDKRFDFGTGVPDFGTNSPPSLTSLTLSGDAAAPSFVITSGASSASGIMTYGSCIFKVTQSTFTAGPLVLNNTFPVSPCGLTVATAGIKGDGIATSASVTFVLGATPSTPVSVPVSISPDGVLTVNGITIPGKVVLVAATGAGS